MSSSDGKDMTPSMGPVVLSLKDELECIICLDFAVSPIHSCANGHIICGVCKDKLGEAKCSLCLKRLNVMEFLERMAKKMEVRLDCLNSSDGCKEKVLSTEFKKHLESCEFRPIDCHEGSCRGIKIPFSQYFDHFQQTHLRDPSRDVEASTVFADSMPDNSKTLSVCKYMVRVKGRVFMETTYRSRTTIYAMAELLGSKKEADKFQYKVTAKTYGPTMKEISMTYVVPVSPFHSNNGGLKVLEHAVPIPNIYIQMIPQAYSQFIPRK